MAAAPGELERHALAQANRVKRQAFRAGLMAKFAGDPVAYQQLVADSYVLVEFQQDMALAPDDASDWEGPAGNQDLNP
jgi:hypothetical protein